MHFLIQFIHLIISDILVFRSSYDHLLQYLPQLVYNFRVCTFGTNIADMIQDAHVVWVQLPIFWLLIGALQQIVQK